MHLLLATSSGFQFIPLGGKQPYLLTATLMLNIVIMFSTITCITNTSHDKIHPAVMEHKAIFHISMRKNYEHNPKCSRAKTKSKTIKGTTVIQ